MLSRGFDVDPTDGSPELAQEASALLQRPVRQLLFTSLMQLTATMAFMLRRRFFMQSVPIYQIS